MDSLITGVRLMQVHFAPRTPQYDPKPPKPRKTRSLAELQEMAMQAIANAPPPSWQIEHMTDLPPNMSEDYKKKGKGKRTTVAKTLPGPARSVQKGPTPMMKKVLSNTKRVQSATSKAPKNKPHHTSGAGPARPPPTRPTPAAEPLFSRVPQRAGEAGPARPPPTRPSPAAEASLTRVLPKAPATRRPPVNYNITKHYPDSMDVIDPTIFYNFATWKEMSHHLPKVTLEYDKLPEPNTPLFVNIPDSDLSGYAICTDASLFHFDVYAFAADGSTYRKKDRVEQDWWIGSQNLPREMVNEILQWSPETKQLAAREGVRFDWRGWIESPKKTRVEWDEDGRYLAKFNWNPSIGIEWIPDVTEAGYASEQRFEQIDGAEDIAKSILVDDAWVSVSTFGTLVFSVQQKVRPPALTAKQACTYTP